MFQPKILQLLSGKKKILQLPSYNINFLLASGMTKKARRHPR